MVSEVVPTIDARIDVVVSKPVSTCCIIIPALNPSAGLVGLVEELGSAGFKYIVVVDDGSAEPFQSVFSALAQMGVTVLRHADNRGKGAALKTGFRNAQERGCAAVVTVDADGQHLPVDVVRVAESVLSKTAPACVLGVRSFRGQVPLRSKFGNRVTQKLFKALSSLAVSDTQTGLRGFSGDLLSRLGAVHGDRYEFEMEMLLWLVREEIPVTELPIETVYLDNNAQSHFRPLIDSFRIYWVLFRDLFVAASSFVIDIVLFSTFFAISGSVLGSTYLARVVSGTYNFLGNRHFVFRTAKNQRFMREAFRYVGLAILIASASGVLVSLLFDLTNLAVTPCKILVDVSMYGASFLIRRHLIFAVRNNGEVKD